jgi:hypothetical protein
MSDNLETRVQASVELVEGPIFGKNLMCTFKEQLLLQKVFRLMFGDGGERIFINEMPNINQEITPLLILKWNADTFNSGDVYYTGMIDAVIGLPVQVSGDENALKEVASVMQRFIGGPMKMFDPKKNPGLIKFGYGAEFKYGGMFDLSGIKLPAIEFTLPFQFDLQQMIIQQPGVDFFADLDVANLPWITQVTVGLEPTDKNLNPVTPSIELEVTSETGQTN